MTPCTRKSKCQYIISDLQNWVPEEESVLLWSNRKNSLSYGLKTGELHYDLEMKNIVNGIVFIKLILFETYVQIIKLIIFKTYV